MKVTARRDNVHAKRLAARPAHNSHDAIQRPADNKLVRGRARATTVPQSRADPAILPPIGLWAINTLPTHTPRPPSVNKPRHARGMALQRGFICARKSNRNYAERPSRLLTPTAGNNLTRSTVRRRQATARISMTQCRDDPRQTFPQKTPDYTTSRGF